LDDVNLPGAMPRILAWITKQLRGYNYSKQTLVSQLGWEMAVSERNVRLGSRGGGGGGGGVRGGEEEDKERGTERRKNGIVRREKFLA